jgi:hypothetical protein
MLSSQTQYLTLGFGLGEAGLFHRPNHGKSLAMILPYWAKEAIRISGIKHPMENPGIEQRNRIADEIDGQTECVS